MRAISRLLGRRCGGSTGTNFWACIVLIAEMLRRGERGSIVTLLCDPGERYLGSLYDDRRLAACGLDLQPCAAALDVFLATGQFTA